MILIEINIINFKEIFREKYAYYGNLDMYILKEYKDNILLYERKMGRARGAIQKLYYYYRYIGYATYHKNENGTCGALW